MGRLKNWIRPLSFHALDDARKDDARPTADQILDYLTAREVICGVDGFCDRYAEVAEVQDALPVVAAEEIILEKLVWPLRHAKGSYALGNYIGCIALCGFVGEMAAVLLWDISDFGRRLAAENQNRLFGKPFEKLGQARRVQVLQGLGLVDPETANEFTTAAEKRNKYLHLLSFSHDQISEDARAAFESAMAIVKFVIGPTSNSGTVVLREDLSRYLRERGVLYEVEPDEHA